MQKASKTKKFWAILLILTMAVSGATLPVAAAPVLAQNTGGLQAVAETIFPEVLSETSGATAGYVNGIAVGLPTQPPEGDITYRGTIGPNIGLLKVYASITARNEKSTDVAGTMTLQNIGSDGTTVTNTISKDVVFTARRNSQRSVNDDRYEIDNTYIPGESFVLTFTVNGQVVACFERGPTVAKNTQNQLFSTMGMTGYDDANSVSTTDPVWNWPQTFGQARIARWDGDRIGAMAITIDDNLIGDHPTWRRLAAYYDIPLSWVVIGGDQFVFGEYESWRRSQELGMGFQSHTYTHFATITTGEVTPARTQLVLDEYAKSSDAISKMTGGVVPKVMAFPGGNSYGPTAADKLMAWDYFVTERSNYSGATSTLSSGDGISRSDYENYILMLIDPTRTRWGAGAYGGFNSTYFHSVGTGADDATAAGMLGLLHQNRDQIWAGLSADLISYTKERATATLTTVSAGSQEIKLNLTDLLHDDTYDYPLTLKLKIGEDWEGVKVTQNGKTEYGKVLTKDGVKQALIKAVPDRGEISVVPCSAAEAAAGTPERAARSKASLYSLTYQSADSVSRTIPGFVNNQQGGEYTVSVPADTASLTVSARETYCEESVSYSETGGVADLSSGDKSITVTVTSANGQVVNVYTIHFIKDTGASPLVDSVIYQEPFNELLRFSTSSGDPARFNGLSSALGGYDSSYVDPENRENNTAFKLKSAGASAYITKTYLAPKRAEMGISAKVYIPTNPAGTYSDIKISFAGTDVIYLDWDAATSKYNWYAGGNGTAGTLGGTVSLSRWANVSLYIKAADTGATLTERWTSSTVTARVTQAVDETGAVATNTAAKTGVPCSTWNASGQAGSVIGLYNGVAGNEMLLDDVLFYNPVSDAELLPTPTPTTSPTATPTTSPTATPTATPTPTPTPTLNPTIATLSTLTYQVSGGKVKNVTGFTATDTTKTYNVTLPYNAASVTVAAAMTATNSTLVISPTGGVVNVTSGSGTATVTVTSADQTVVNTYTVVFAVSPTQEPDPVYTKIFKYHFDYSWVTPDATLSTSSTAAGNDGATSTVPDGRWAGTGGTVRIAAWDPEDATNKCFKIGYNTNYIDGFISKNQLKPASAFVISGRLRMDATSAGHVAVRFAGKDLLTFTYDTSAGNYTWSVGTTASGGRVEKEKWIKYDIYVEPDGTNWANATLTGYVSGDIKNASGTTVTQIAAVQTAFDTGHDGTTARTFGIYVPKAQRSYLYVDDTYIYQPGLMTLEATSATADVSPTGTIALRTVSGDTPLGADVSTNRRMGQDLDLSTLTASTASIVPVGGGTVITPAVAANPAKPDTFTVDLAGTPLAGNTTYTLVVNDNLLDVAGRSIDSDANSITFTTGAASNAAAPAVTADDVGNLIDGLDLGTMEYAVSIDNGLTFGSYTSDSGPNLGGSKTVKVRVKAADGQLAGIDAILTFTPNPGDISGDGMIDISDVIMTAEIAVGYTGYTSEQRTRANVSDKTITTVDISDVVMIAERAVGGNATFPVE